MAMDLIEKAVNTLIRNDSVIDMPDTSVTSRKIGSSQTKKIPVPQSVLRQNRVLTPDADPAVIRAYKILRTRVLQRMNQNGWTTLGITSPTPDNGKTLTAINLSISLARKLDYTVLLIDVAVVPKLARRRIERHNAALRIGDRPDQAIVVLGHAHSHLASRFVKERELPLGRIEFDKMAVEVRVELIAAR